MLAYLIITTKYLNEKRTFLCVNEKHSYIAIHKNTNEMKFIGTKGKWEVSPSGNDQFDTCIVAEDGGSVCFITNWIPEQEANAKLIAAAPDLLEALQIFIDPLTGLVVDFVAHKIGSKDAYAIEQSIEKALN